MTEVSRESIDRFFRNACSAEEAERVVRYLEQNPGLLDDYAGRQEWSKDQPAVPLPGILKDEMRKHVYEITRPMVHKISRVRYMWMMKTAVAACIAGLLILGIIRIHPGRHMAGSINPGRVSHEVAALYHITVITNTGDGKKKFSTADGSNIELSAHSELSYEEPFAANARDFRLKGEAFFDVAKDPVRPFTVFAGGIVTTALGTSFRVRAAAAESNVSVRLITGKVSVRSETAMTNMRRGPATLSPGDEMIFDRRTQSMAFHSSRRRDGGSAGTTSETAETWAFFNQPLPEIARTLQMAYTREISCSAAGLSGIRFTGTFNKSDSLSYILNTIGSMSKLRIIKNDGGYTIEK